MASTEGALAFVKGLGAVHSMSHAAGRIKSLRLHKVGIIPGDGGAWLLPRVVGFSKACEMTFTGESLDATAALSCGLVSQVVPDSELLSAAYALAERIAANPPHALRMAKRLLVQGREMAQLPLLELAAQMQALAHTSRDHGEAVEAFLEKRAPRFTGR